MMATGRTDGSKANGSRKKSPPSNARQQAKGLSVRQAQRLRRKLNEAAWDLQVAGENVKIAIGNIDAEKKRADGLQAELDRARSTEATLNAQLVNAVNGWDDRGAQLRTIAGSLLNGDEAALGLVAEIRTELYVARTELRSISTVACLAIDGLTAQINSVAGILRANMAYARSVAAVGAERSVEGAKGEGPTGEIKSENYALEVNKD